MRTLSSFFINKTQATYLRKINVDLLIKSGPSLLPCGLILLIQIEIGIKAIIGPIIVELKRIDPYKPSFETSVVNTTYWDIAKIKPHSDNIFPIVFSDRPKPPALDIQNNGNPSSIVVLTNDDSQNTIIWFLVFRCDHSDEIVAVASGLAGPIERVDAFQALSRLCRRRCDIVVECLRTESVMDRRESDDVANKSEYSS